ncbi:ABC transporter, CydDC cysteine exporter (CydDC-E) family, permease/ATP-binding protein CydC [uncultured Pleomorphomonas sp.]|uniref:ABC transporter, CydDC cysteine exporter (CydDC-E) family, permease/ATP-binding protein CydC n=1 Tax=uncultured Pleomorphomonas sp. TaxID=442121 RepID=A0A212LKD5_9HYPH|nr:thiol reductant ABC exporter subunit CydC [uncultured Pleomorphomonas sp.]SCM78011.1 ABC transporter, CydDC cysteine exporter (CydDC-E) family, permease/ATP-binding protein CydC [uncultured Pleomorphomonas sp.]
MKDLLRLLGLYRRHVGWILLSMLVSLVATLANVGLMAISGWFITAMAAAGLTGIAMNYFTPAAIIRTLAILRTGGRYVDRVVGHEATLRLLADTRAHLFARMVPLAPAALDDLRSGDLLARLKADIDRLELTFLRLLSPLIVALLTLAAVGLLLFLYDGLLSAGVLAVLAGCGLLAPALAAVAAAGPGRALTARSADLRRLVVDDLSGLMPLIAVGAFAGHRDRLVGAMASLVQAERRLARRAAFRQALGRLSGDLALIVALAVGVPLVAASRMEGPDLAMAALLSLSAAEVFMGLPAAFLGVSSTLASARRLFAILDRKPPVIEPANPRPLPEGRDLRLDGVTLRYPGGLRPAVDGVSLDIPFGSRMALVGESGAGKSSIAALLARLRDPDLGEIRLGGVPLADLALADVRRTVGVVPQRPHLFTLTLEENLRLGRPSATAEELAAAIEAAGLADFVARLPQGLATPVGVAGATLSGGEARRVAIARALLPDPDILILDEPGEGLDPETEAAVLERVLDRMAGRTVILITHARAALHRMDRLVKLDEGRIVANRAASEV